MKFGEQFPSLKEANCECWHCREYGDDDELHAVSIEDIEKHCLDKQRVKDIICDMSYQANNGDMVVDVDELLEELNLGDE